jgi:hypothetical protein
LRADYGDDLVALLAVERQELRVDRFHSRLGGAQQARRTHPLLRRLGNGS